MISKLIKHSLYNFSRSLKAKKYLASENKLGEKETHKRLNEQSHDVKIPKAGQPHFPQSYVNKQMRQFDQNLEKKVDQMIEAGFNKQAIIQQLSLIKEYKGQNQEKLIEIEQTQEEKKYLAQLDILEKQDEMINSIMRNRDKTKQKELPLGKKFRDELVPDEEKYLLKEKIMNEVRKRIPLQINYEHYEQLLQEKNNTKLVKKSDDLVSSSLLAFKKTIMNQQDERKDRKSIIEMRIKKDETFLEAIENKKLKKERKKQIEQFFTSQIDPKILKELKDSKQEKTGLSIYQDEDYYKEKALREFKQVELLSEENEIIKQSGNKDAEKGQDLMDIFLEETEEPQLLKYEKKQIYEESSFGKHAGKVKQLQDKLMKHGLSFSVEQISSLDKQMLFSQKQLREQQLAYQKYLHKKQKKKKMNEYMSKIHDQKLRDDVDFQHNFKERYQDPQFDPLNIQENMKKFQIEERQRQSVIKGQDERSRIHFQKTQKKMGDFIRSFFYKNFCNANSTITEKISVIKLIFNEKKTVINIFWRFHDKSLDENQEQINSIQSKLRKKSGYISGKMTQLLELRYGPDIRFHYDRILPKTQQIIKQLANKRDQIIEFEIQNMKKKGLVKNKQDQKDYREKLRGIADSNLSQYHNRKKLLSREYRFESRRFSKEKLHKKKQKKDPVNKFWEEVDQL